MLRLLGFSERVVSSQNSKTAQVTIVMVSSRESSKRNRGR